MKKYLIIIPARGGSKSIKNKNVVLINKKPLIQYTIKASLEVIRLLKGSRLIVSTDSEKIARIAKRLRVEVPFLRPKSLSGNRSKSIEFVQHALKYFINIGITFDAVIILQPTSPLRKAEDILNCINLFEKYHGIYSVFSCYKEETISDLIMYRRNDDYALPMNKMHNKGVRRQEHDVLYVRNGSVYITPVDLIEKKNLIITDKPLMYVMPKSRSINLDSPEDLVILRNTLCG
jgi:N-acylneuraminate cytidylyltransferase/CMP-N,N'-diacetyllegionaminic acid synthase